MLNIFLWFLKIGSFSFGGGLATLPIIYEMARSTGWVSESEVTDIITLSQITPGPLACNIATFVGNKSQGIVGAVLAVFAFIIPAIIYMTIFYKCIQKVQNNEKFDFVMSFVRATGFATIVYGSWKVLKTVIFMEHECFVIKNIFQIINYKAALATIMLCFIVKKSKISSLKTFVFGGILGLILQI